MQEVLERQSQSVQSFLPRTSILGQMYSSLCAAVVAQDAIARTDILEQLERQNLFVVPLDSDRTWYRYHHLFAESLRHILHRTEPDCVLRYHDHAAQWYEQQGDIANAIHHAIAARMFEDAARMIEQEIQTSENPRLNAIVLRNALVELPPQLIHTRPWLLVAKAWAAFTSSQFADAIIAIQTLEQFLHENNPVPEPTDRLWGLVFAFKGMQARQRSNENKYTRTVQKRTLQSKNSDHKSRL